MHVGVFCFSGLIDFVIPVLKSISMLLQKYVGDTLFVLTIGTKTRWYMCNNYMLKSKEPINVCYI